MQRFKHLSWTIMIYFELCDYMIDKYLILCLDNIQQSRKYIIFKALNTYEINITFD